MLNKVAFYESKNTHCIHENVIQICPSITDRSADSYANKQSFLINNFASDTHARTRACTHARAHTHTGSYPFVCGKDRCACVPVDEGCVEHVGGA